MQQDDRDTTGQATDLLTVLVIEDEENIVELIELGLRYEGFQVSATADGLEGIAAAQRLNPDVVILDLGLPGDIDGLEICRRLRQNPTTQDVSILILTAKSRPHDKVVGLNAGAELVARIRAILRRKHPPSQTSNNQQNDQILEFDDITMNLATHEVTRASRLIALTTTEFNLLHLFMSHPQQVLDRETILNRVWGYNFLGETNIIEVYVRYLREKIEETPSTPRLIQTVRGVGYILKG